MKTRKSILRILSFILILTVSVIPTLVTSSAATTQYDYSKEGSFFNTERSTADILTEMGCILTDAERAYLEEYGNLSVSYDEVTTQHVTVITSDDSCRVIAREYSYTSRQGSVATWVPLTAKIDSKEVALTKGTDGYTAELGAVEVDETTTVGVEYELRVDGGFVFSRESINEALNLALNAAPSIKSSYTSALERESAYNDFYAQNKAAVDTYYTNLELYRSYARDKVAYDERVRAYNEYTLAISQYEDDSVRYEAYVAELAAYNYALDYNRNFDTHLANYYAELAAYNGYFADIETVRTQLDTLDTALMDKVTSLDRQLYSSIFSSLVDQVVENASAFEMIGADKQSLIDCKNATAILRNILRNYNKIESEQDKYAFYVANYEKLRDNVILLTRCLENFYTKPMIRETMHVNNVESKTQKFVIFVAQLVLFSNALSDEPIMDYTNSYVLDKNTAMSYLVGTGKNNYVTETMLEILENDEYIKDTGNAAPLVGGYPQKVEHPGDEPTLMQVPAKPEEVARPVAPDVVDEPGDEPTPVPNPEQSKPAGLAELELTDSEREILANQTYINLVTEYDKGTLTEREAVTEDYTYTPTKLVEKRLRGVDSVNVSFTDAYGAELLTVSVDKNTAANFSGDLPVKAEDVSATYTFDKWVDSEGRAYDLSSVSSSVTLSPSYITNYKSYEYATVDGASYLNVYAPDTVVGIIPTEHFIALAKENVSGILITAENLVIRIPYSDVAKLDGAGVAYLYTATDTSNSSAYTCEITPKGRDGAIIDTTLTLSVMLPCADSAFATSSFLTYEDASGNTVSAYKTYKDGYVSFKLRLGAPYLMCVRYSVNIAPSSVSISASSNSAIPGQTVTIDFETPEGKIVELYYFDADGNKHAIEGNSFIMPDGYVSIGASLRAIEYVITFISDGKVISTYKYKHGETVSVPLDPVKQNDGGYSYTFVGWTPEVSELALADATYTAEFSATELPKEDNSGIRLSPKYMKLFKIGVACLVIFVVLVAGGITLIVVLRKRKKNAEATVDSAARFEQGTDVSDDSRGADLTPVGDNTDTPERVENEEGENEGK